LVLHHTIIAMYSDLAKKGFENSFIFNQCKCSYFIKQSQKCYCIDDNLNVPLMLQVRSAES